MAKKPPNSLADKAKRSDRFYVYVLAHPITLDIFYVGKGCGDRCNQHYKNWQKVHIDNYSKHIKITEIVASGHEPLVYKIQENMYELDALRLEADVINALENLTNGRKEISDIKKQKMFASALLEGFCDKEFCSAPRTEEHIERYVKLKSFSIRMSQEGIPTTMEFTSSERIYDITEDMKFVWNKKPFPIWDIVYGYG